jgi:acyl-CoA thioesterase-1
MLVLRFARTIAVAALVVLAPLASALAESVAPVVLVVGDSISAAYGLAPGTGWVDLLSARLASEHYPHRVVNASITGDTTAGGRTRLPALIATHKPAIVVVELGGNDGLRGGNLASARDNLATMVGPRSGRGRRRSSSDEAPAQLPRRVCAETTRPTRTLRKRTRRRSSRFSSRLRRAQRNVPARSHPPRGRSAAALLDNVWPTLKPLLGKPQ